MFENLKNGNFADRERVRTYAIISLVIMIAACAWVLAGANGNLAADGKPLGTDFANVYAAGVMANEGQAAEVWDWGIHFDKQAELLGPGLETRYGWHYPPFFLIIASLLAFFPYLVALGLWNLAGFVFYLGVMRRIVGRYEGWLLPVIGFPAIFVNVTHGHNGFLTAGLFGLAFLSIEKRPWLAGIFIGLLAYKPQFGLLIPLALLVGGYYRTFLSASVTVLCMCGIVTAIYGFDIWPAFLESFELTRNIILEQGSTGWYKIQSIFSFIMLWTGSLPLAYGLQTALSIAVLAVTLLAFWKPNLIEDRAAIIILGGLLVTPYSLDYDLAAVAPAIGFLVLRGIRDGFSNFEVLALSLLWFAPLFTRPLMMATGIPIALIALLWVFAIVAMRIGRDAWRLHSSSKVA